MPADSIRDQWDRAADGYAAGQDAGLDFYRHEFFGPAQIALCGEVRGLNLLDVGCGTGYFAREMAARSARVTAIDISPRMIEIARGREAASPPGIDYRTVDAANLDAEFMPGTFDMATSCLALQDMEQPAQALRAVAAVLRSGGRFVASIEHPCTNPPFRAWERDAHGRKRWLCIDRYYDKGPRQYTWTRWPGAFTTTARHAPLEDWVGWISAAGFTIAALREPRPTDEAVRARPALADAQRVPYFIMWILELRT